MNTIEEIKKFVNGPLSNKLRDDAKNFHILNERDLEHRIYHHLASNIDQKRFLIFTNKTFSGIKANKNPFGWGTMPDLIIRDRKCNNDISLVMELKAQKNAKTSFVGKALQKAIFKDCKKLKKYLDNKKLKNQIKYCFMVYMYRDKRPKHSEKEITKILKEQLPDKRLFALCVNKYQNRNGTFLSEKKIKTFSNNFDNLYQIKVGPKKNKKKSTSNNSRSKASKKANKTMDQRVKDPKWRKEHPNAHKTLQYNRSHGLA